LFLVFVLLASDSNSIEVSSQPVPIFRDRSVVHVKRYSASMQ